jgi:hypothetical protein
MIAIDCAPQIHIAAIHAQAGYNNDTPGIGLLCPIANNTRLAIGTYRNSLSMQSNYAAIAWQPLRLGPMRVGAMAGVVSGYRRDFTPMAALAVSVPVRAIELHMVAVPAVSGASPATAALSVSFKF